MTYLELVIWQGAAMVVLTIVAAVVLFYLVWRDEHATDL